MTLVDEDKVGNTLADVDLLCPFTPPPPSHPPTLTGPESGVLERCDQGTTAGESSTAVAAVLAASTVEGVLSSISGVLGRLVGGMGARFRW